MPDLLVRQLPHELRHPLLRRRPSRARLHRHRTIRYRSRRPNLRLENRLPTHRPRPPDDHRLQHHAQRTRIQSTRNHLHPHQALNRDHPTAFREGEAPAEPMQIDRAGNRCRYKPLRLFPLQTGAIHCPFRRGSPQKPPSKCVQLIQIPCRTLLNLALTLLNFG